MLWRPSEILHYCVFSLSSFHLPRVSGLGGLVAGDVPAIGLAPTIPVSLLPARLPPLGLGVVVVGTTWGLGTSKLG